MLVKIFRTAILIDKIRRGFIVKISAGFMVKIGVRLDLFFADQANDNYFSQRQVRDVVHGTFKFRC